MNITIISGSPRMNSVTHRIALHLQNFLHETTSHEVAIIVMKEWHLPMVQSVWTSPQAAPADFRPLAEQMFATDAFILVTPEYNGSYSPALKNLLDHLPKQHHKTFGIVTASPGAMGGMRAAQQLLLLVPALFGIVSPYMLVVPGVEKKFSESGELLDEKFEHTVHNFVTEFLWLSEKTVSEKIFA